jgi:CO/xanthine dehydrogenase FAD-binding subunit
LRAPEAEAWLASRLDWTGPGWAERVSAAELGDGLGSLVSGAARPIDDHRSTVRYRRHAVGVLASRAAVRLFGAA